MIRKESTKGIGYSVVELNDVRHVFAAAIPRSGSSVQEQTRDALRTIETIVKEEGTWASIVRQAVFMKDVGQREACRQIVREFYGDELPATTYIPQSPCAGKLLVIEALGIDTGRGDVQIERHSEQMVVTRHDGVSWVHCANFLPQTSATGVYDRSLDAFKRMSAALASQGVAYEQVIRTWLYLGDIVGPEGQTQRYKELNRARTDFYEGLRFVAGQTPPGSHKPVYPASTGIGADGTDVVMSCIALATDSPDTVLLPLENPQQTSAFDYRTQYSPKSPKFARAMAIKACGYATIFISGTASITNSETRFVGDVEGQTRQTLENIQALISHDNFQRHGMPELGATLEDLALVRVYIKRQEDFAKTRAVCEELLGELPTVYAVADVCREELLVEIEGIAFAQPVAG